MANLIGMAAIVLAWAAIAVGLVGLVSPEFALLPSRWAALALLSSSMIFAGINADMAMPDGSRVQGASAFMLLLWLAGCGAVMLLRHWIARRKPDDREPPGNNP